MIAGSRALPQGAWTGLLAIRVAIGLLFGHGVQKLFGWVGGGGPGGTGSFFEALRLSPAGRWRSPPGSARSRAAC